MTRMSRPLSSPPSSSPQPRSKRNYAASHGGLQSREDIQLMLELIFILIVLFVITKMEGKSGSFKWEDPTSDQDKETTP